LGSDYAFITAYLKGEESKTVVSSQFAGLVRVSRIQDVLSAIDGTDIGSYLSGVSLSSFDEVDSNLWVYFGKCLERIYWFNDVPGDVRILLRAYITKYYVINIKRVLQGIPAGKKF
jgi:vacuolar-type H+-ATPase subunit C/Vma6